jgi:DNA-binding NtrC family response regulator
MPLVGRSAAMQDIYRMLARMMQTDLTVMITGRSGTGKELVAPPCTSMCQPSRWLLSRRYGGDPRD